MALKDHLAKEVDSILNQEWAIRDGQVVPTTESVALSGGAVKLDATMLYADLADSTELVMNYDRRVAARSSKVFSHVHSGSLKVAGVKSEASTVTELWAFLLEATRTPQRQNALSRSTMRSKTS